MVFLPLAPMWGMPVVVEGEQAGRSWLFGLIQEPATKIFTEIHGVLPAPRTSSSSTGHRRLLLWQLNGAITMIRLLPPTVPLLVQGMQSVIDLPTPPKRNSVAARENDTAGQPLDIGAPFYE